MLFPGELFNYDAFMALSIVLTKRRSDQGRRSQGAKGDGIGLVRRCSFWWLAWFVMPVELGLLSGLVVRRRWDVSGRFDIVSIWEIGEGKLKGRSTYCTASQGIDICANASRNS